MAERRKLYYTFGNHMHWVDMEWLWGYHVLPGSVRDMLRFCQEAGVKGNVNFDGVGYEKLAAEDPEALAGLREAVRDALIEPVGCSYGQPYGLFHGGESNIRQRVYGVRAVMRLLGVRPRTFWEEEFDFFPQLPQMLAGVGFTGASLFFQWTWHTPEVPVEESPVVWWEGADGTRILATTRNRLNLHQWPEDMDMLLKDLAADAPEVDQIPPLIQQWLELMPSPDWMCRSEVLLPKMKELLEDPRFEIVPATLEEYLAKWHRHLGATPVRYYTMDDVWHGLSLGKNGDRMRRLSWKTESAILRAESLAATLGLFGRPYAQWDVYPTWELEEAWRELLQAQHHDNDECEGLCGRVGVRSYERARGLADDVYQLQVESLDGAREEAAEPADIAINPLGWSRTTLVDHPRDDGSKAVLHLAPYEVRLVPISASAERPAPRPGWLATVDQGAVVQIRAPQFPEGALRAPFGAIVGRVRSEEIRFGVAPMHEPEWVPTAGQTVTTLAPVGRADLEIDASVTVSEVRAPEAVDVTIELAGFEAQPDPGLAAGWRTSLLPAFDIATVWADTPYAVQEVIRGSLGKRKYPSGDWMTSPQWFEDVHGAFTAYSLVDLVDREGNGILLLHNGSQQFWLTDNGIEIQLGTLDPWDEARATADFRASFRLIPHGPMSHSQRWRLAQEFRNPVQIHMAGQTREFAFHPLAVAPDNVLLTALYRETEDYSGRALEAYAGRGMGYPYVVRLVEFDGEPAEVELKVAGEVAIACRTNLLGETEELVFPDVRSEVTVIDQPVHPKTGKQTRLTFTMRPREIATLYLDIVEGRKQVRDLDAKREVWATVHRTE
jgi:alpha-mannosidase